MLKAGAKVIVNRLYAGTITELFIGGFNYYDTDGVERSCYYSTDSYTLSDRGLTNDELALLRHVSMYGSDGYPVRKLRPGKWIWGPYRTVAGPPTIFATKRAAVASFEAFTDVLRDALAGRL